MSSCSQAPCRSWHPGIGETDGSAIRALSRPFTDFVFVDIDPVATDALSRRIAEVDTAGKAVHVVRADCNDAVDAIHGLVPSAALTLAFVDPTAWQVRFDTIRSLVDGRRVDLLMTVHTGSMRRVRQLPAPALDAYYGTGAWRDALKLPRAEQAPALLDLYGRQLIPLGYEAPDANARVAVVNGRNVTMYQLTLYSKHPLGVDFWRKVSTGPTESGQRRLWDDL